MAKIGQAFQVVAIQYLLTWQMPAIVKQMAEKTQVQGTKVMIPWLYHVFVGFSHDCPM